MKNDVYLTAYDLGENYLNIMKKNNYFSLKYPAVMFDIDDTLINYKGKPIKPIIKLLNKCIKEELIVVIITARLNIYTTETIKQLQDEGIKYAFLYLRSQNDDINTFKGNIKRKLAEENDIVTIMSIGDNIVDVEGESSGYFIKLPNNVDPNLYHLNTNGILEIINV
jgi:predicted HAD superfamily phosphohydrolase YqeG